MEARLVDLEPASLQLAVRDATSGGKKLRPHIALWFADALAVETSVADSVACLTEWLHSAFLIHDDIQDGDEWRRDQPTLWKQHGVSTALNSADWLLSRVYQEVASMGLPGATGGRLLAAVTDVHQRTVMGQQFDLDGRADPHFNLERYEEAVQSKTGRYLALGMVAIAIVADLDERVTDTLWRVGDELGPAFQIQDDLLDMTHHKGRGGQLGNDVKEGKPSILYAHALDRGELSDGDRTRLVEVMGTEREKTTDADVNWVIELCKRCGAIDFARQQAQSRARSGIELFASIHEIDGSLHQQFEEIARFAVERDR